MIVKLKEKQFKSIVIVSTKDKPETGCAFFL